MSEVGLTEDSIPYSIAISPEAAELDHLRVGSSPSNPSKLPSRTEIESWGLPAVATPRTETRARAESFMIFSGLE